jgi:hypothetical protein
MLTGELPLGKFAPPSFGPRGLRVDVRLDEVVLRALEKEPDRRYQHASQVKTAVETIASTPPGAGGPGGPGGPGAPPPFGTPPPPSGPTPEVILAHDYNLDIGRCFDRGWALIQAHFWPLVGMSALFIILFSAVDSAFNRVVTVGGGGSGGTGVSEGGSILSMIFTGPLCGGLYLYFLKKIRGQPATVETAFAGFSQRFLHLFLANFIATFIIGTVFIFGLLFCLLPCLLAIYPAVIWSFSLVLIIDKGLDFWAAMELSRKMVNKHWFEVFIFLFLMSLLFLAGFLACCVGVFFTLPIAIAAFLYAYEDIFCPPIPAAPLAGARPPGSPPPGPGASAAAGASAPGSAPGPIGPTGTTILPNSPVNPPLAATPATPATNSKIYAVVAIIALFVLLGLGALTSLSALRLVEPHRMVSSDPFHAGIPMPWSHYGERSTTGLLGLGMLGAGIIAVCVVAVILLFLFLRKKSPPSPAADTGTPPSAATAPGTPSAASPVSPAPVAGKPERLLPSLLLLLGGTLLLLVGLEVLSFETDRHLNDRMVPAIGPILSLALAAPVALIAILVGCRGVFRSRNAPPSGGFKQVLKILLLLLTGLLTVLLAAILILAHLVGVPSTSNWNVSYNYPNMPAMPTMPTMPQIPAIPTPVIPTAGTPATAPQPYYENHPDYNLLVKRTREELAKIPARFDQLHIAGINDNNFVVMLSGLQVVQLVNGQDTWMGVDGNLQAVQAGDGSWDFTGNGQLGLVRFSLPKLDLASVQAASWTVVNQPSKPAYTAAGFATRLAAAQKIEESDLRDKTMGDLVHDAAVAGDIPNLQMALGQITDADQRDASARETAVALAAAGKRDEAITIAESITDSTLRDQTLSELAK